MCEHCELKGRCPMLNKAECPINSLWHDADEAEATLADFEEFQKTNSLT